jgi:hypothetical protein
VKGNAPVNRCIFPERPETIVSGAKIHEVQAFKAEETLLQGVMDFARIFQWAPVSCAV